MTHKIFISYARKDGRDLALKLQTTLQAQDFDVWLDTSEIDGGASWSSDIEDAIDTCQTLLALLSEGSYHSEICRGEHLRALRKGKRVIPILVQTDVDRPIYLEGGNYRDMSNDTQFDTQFALLLSDMESDEFIHENVQITPVIAPDFPANYVERPEVLQNLRETLVSDATDSRNVALTAVRGMGGIGKSVMSIAICHDAVIQDAFPDGIFWLEIGREVPNVLEKMRIVGTTLGDSTEQYGSIDSAEARLREILPNKACLLILDDVWDKRVIQPFLIRSAQSRILITTRDGQISTDLGASEIRLGKLSEAQGRELLMKWAKIAERTTELDEIVRVLDGHPLALKIVGAKIASGITAQEWLTSYDGVTGLKSGRRAKLKDDNLAVCFDISVESLEDDQPLYHALGIFPEDVWIPETIITLLWRTLDPDIDKHDCIEILLELEKLALIDIERQDDERGIRMHDLLHSYNKHKLGDEYLPIQTQFIDALGNPHTLPHPYAFREYAYHLSEANRLAELILLLTDLPFIEAKLHATEPASFIKDVDTLVRARHVSPLLQDEGLQSITRIMRSFWSISSHILSDPEQHTQLYNQLIGRLGLHEESQPAIATLLNTVRDTAENHPTPQLILQKPTLEPAGGMLERIFKGHTDGVSGAIELRDGNILSWSEDNSLQLWGKDGQFLTTFGHNDWVRGAIQLNKDHILSWSKDHTLGLWTVEGNWILSSNFHNDDVGGAMLLNDGRILSWSNDSTLCIWNLTKDTKIGLVGHSKPIVGALELHNGRILSWSEDRTLRLWDDEGIFIKQFEIHRSYILGAIQIANGHIVSWGMEKTLYLWDLDGTLIKPLLGHTRSITGVLELSDGRLLSWSGQFGSTDHTIHLWSNDGNLLNILDKHHSGVRNVIELTDGQILSWDWHYDLYLWNSEGEFIKTLEGHSFTINGASQLKNGNILSWGRDNSLRLWDSKGRFLSVFEGHNSWVDGGLELSSGFILSWSKDQTLRLWNLNSKHLQLPESHIYSVNGVKVLQNNNILSWAGGFGSKDFTLRIWDTSGNLIKRLHGHVDIINGALELNNGQILSWSKDNTLRLWDEHGEKINHLKGHKHQVRGAIELSNGQILSWSQDKTLYLWDEHGEKIDQLKKHSKAINGATQLSNKHILSWSQDKTLRLWDEHGAYIRLMEAHDDVVRGAIQLKNGNIISWGVDNTFRIWSSDGNLIRTLSENTGSIWSLIELNNGQILSSGLDGMLRLWKNNGDFISIVQDSEMRSDIEKAIYIQNKKPRFWDVAESEDKIVNISLDEVLPFVSDGRLNRCQVPN